MKDYILAFDEINALTEYSYQTNKNEDETVSQRIARITDDILSFLINAYVLGIQHASEQLQTVLSVDTEEMYQAIYLVIEGETFEQRIANHMLNEDVSALKTLVESEYHRVYNTAVMDGGRYYANTHIGVTKTWQTVHDDRVRETHSYLEAVTVALEDEFFTFDGDHALYPGGFTKADNNVNCRCIITLNSMNSKISYSYFTWR